MPLLCHRRVPLYCAMVGERVTTNFGGVDVVPLLGAIVVRYGSGGGDRELWGSGRGAIAGCHCSVLWWGQGRVTASFGGVRGAIAGCHCTVPL